MNTALDQYAEALRVIKEQAATITSLKATCDLHAAATEVWKKEAQNRLTEVEWLKAKIKLLQSQ